AAPAAKCHRANALFEPVGELARCMSQPAKDAQNCLRAIAIAATKGERKMPSNQPISRTGFGIFSPLIDYLLDAGQRTLLFWDVLGERGNQYREHLAKVAPHVLDYQAELVIDGRTLARPVNYVLARVIPPTSVELDPEHRPFVIIDPRAGHGPGIG